MAQIGDKVKWKGAQRSSYVPATLQAYLDRNGLTLETAVFTVVDVFSGTRETMVDFGELDTRGGYYAERFEVVPPAVEVGVDVTPTLTYTQEQVDALVGSAVKAALADAAARVTALIAG